MYNFDIQAKVSMLPENAKREIFDFIEFILSKYGQARKRKFRSLDMISINTKSLDIDREELHVRQSIS